MGNVLVVGLVGGLPPVKVLVGVNWPRVVLLEVLVVTGDKDPCGQGGCHDAVGTRINLSVGGVGLVVGNGGHSVVTAVGGQFAHLKQVIRQDSANP